MYLRHLGREPEGVVINQTATTNNHPLNSVNKSESTFKHFLQEGWIKLTLILDGKEYTIYSPTISKVWETELKKKAFYKFSQMIKEYNHPIELRFLIQIIQLASNSWSKLYSTTKPRQVKQDILNGFLENRNLVTVISILARHTRYLGLYCMPNTTGVTFSGWFGVNYTRSLNNALKLIDEYEEKTKLTKEIRSSQSSADLISEPDRYSNLNINQIDQAYLTKEWKNLLISCKDCFNLVKERLINSQKIPILSTRNQSLIREYFLILRKETNKPVYTQLNELATDIKKLTPENQFQIFNFLTKQIKMRLLPDMLKGDEIKQEIIFALLLIYKTDSENLKYLYLNYLVNESNPSLSFKTNDEMVENKDIFKYKKLNESKEIYLKDTYLYQLELFKLINITFIDISKSMLSFYAKFLNSTPPSQEANKEAGQLLKIFLEALDDLCLKQSLPIIDELSLFAKPSFFGNSVSFNIRQPSSQDQSSADIRNSIGKMTEFFYLTIKDQSKLLVENKKRLQVFLDKINRQPQTTSSRNSFA